MTTTRNRFAAAASLLVLCGAVICPAAGEGDAAQRPVEEVSSYETFAAQKGQLLRIETFEIGTVDLSGSGGRLEVAVLRATGLPRDASGMGVRVRWSRVLVRPALGDLKLPAQTEIVGEETVDADELDRLVAAMKTMETEKAGLLEKGADRASMQFQSRGGLAVSVSSAEQQPGRWITIGGKAAWIDDFTPLAALLEKSREKIGSLRGK
jgi:hypothetical protein